ncbi:BLUF domain-containing protein [Stenotrophomonas maltophilia]|uniref:BLUF domain-containing protein n=1 Tax=Stenotrophomonas maltophilia TaxID=40324 RepID=UPI0040416AD8
MSYEAVAFVSAVAAELDSGRLAAIMRDAASFNRSAKVSGVTLYDGFRFLSYMEGPREGLIGAVSRASGSSSHAELVLLARGRVGPRRLPHWPMRCLSARPEELLRVARSEWSSFAQRYGSTAQPETAMAHLAALVRPFTAHSQ